MIIYIVLAKFRKRNFILVDKFWHLNLIEKYNYPGIRIKKAMDDR